MASRLENEDTKLLDNMLDNSLNHRHKAQPPYGTRGAGPLNFWRWGNQGLLVPPNFVTSRVVIYLNFKANPPNSWITYGIFCISCGYSEVCILFMVSFFAALFSPTYAFRFTYLRRLVSYKFTRSLHWPSTISADNCLVSTHVGCSHCMTEWHFGQFAITQGSLYSFVQE